MTSEIQLSIKP